MERNSALSYSQFDERIPVSRQNFIYSGKFSNIEMNSLNTSATAEICDRRWINLATKMEGKRKGRLSSGRLVVIRRITEQLCSPAKLFPRSSNRSHGTSPLSLSLSPSPSLSLSLLTFKYFYLCEIFQRKFLEFSNSSYRLIEFLNVVFFAFFTFFRGKKFASFSLEKFLPVKKISL